MAAVESILLSSSWAMFAYSFLASLALIVMWFRVIEHRKNLTVALDNMDQGLLLFNSSQKIVFCNRRYIEMYGVSPSVVKPGCSLRKLIEHRKSVGTVEEDVDGYCKRIVNRLATGGESFQLDLSSGRSIQIIDRPIASGGWVSTHEDVSERKRLHDRIVYMAHHDALTGLPTRSRFLAHLNDYIGKNSPFALLYIDLDGFKSVNDRFGHAVGDDLLRAAAFKMRISLPENATCARLGGDEFAVLLPGKFEVADIKSDVYRLRQAFAIQLERSGLAIYASIGIARFPHNGLTESELIRRADDAMYRAKRSGKNAFCFWGDESARQDDVHSAH